MPVVRAFVAFLDRSGLLINRQRIFCQAHFDSCPRTVMQPERPESASDQAGNPFEEYA